MVHMLLELQTLQLIGCCTRGTEEEEEEEEAGDVACMRGRPVARSRWRRREGECVAVVARCSGGGACGRGSSEASTTPVNSTAGR